MQLAVTILIIALAGMLILRRVFQLLRGSGKSGCGTGCGSCGKSTDTGGAQSLVPLDLSPKKSP